MSRLRLETKRRILMRELKDFAFEKLPRGSALRDVLLAEDDELDADVFLAKTDVWLKLLNREFS